MQLYKKQFIEFMVQSKVLTFGDFTTKSGRKTPFFINTGSYKTGQQIQKLGSFYADAITNLSIDTATVLFGPAYKGIPLVTTVSIALAQKQSRDIAFCFNRKESKDHGEGGLLIGHKPLDTDRVLIIEDVITAGTSIRETMQLLKQTSRCTVLGVIVSVDRMEKGISNKSALHELREEFGLITSSIVTLDDIVTHLHNNPIDGTIHIDNSMKTSIDLYRAEYGVSQ